MISSLNFSGLSRNPIPARTNNSNYSIFLLHLNRRISNPPKYSVEMSKHPLRNSALPYARALQTVRAVIIFRKGETALARMFADRHEGRLERHPEDAMVMTNYAGLMMEKEEFQKAEILFKKAIKIQDVPQVPTFVCGVHAGWELRFCI